MGYRLVVLDIDGTIWDYPKTSSALPGPIKLGKDCFFSGDGTTIRLREGIRDFLDACSESGIYLSLASWNDPALPSKVLEGLGLLGYFTHPKIQPHPYKDVMLKEIYADFAKDGIHISQKETVFIDDRDVMVQRVKSAFPEVLGLVYGVDFQSYAALKKMLLNTG
ncbi:MAG: magnesium-dependent phosphatase-1 [Thermoprotei archaeon]|nr:magnesium-dependent phosphatase-1 [TACK group archaeon]